LCLDWDGKSGNKGHGTGREGWLFWSDEWNSGFRVLGLGFAGREVIEDRHREAED